MDTTFLAIAIVIICVAFACFSFIVWRLFRLTPRSSPEQCHLPITNQRRLPELPYIPYSPAVEENWRRRQNPPGYLPYDPGRHRLFDIADERLGPDRPFSYIEPPLEDEHQHPAELQQALALTVSQTVMVTQADEDPILPLSLPRVPLPVYQHNACLPPMYMFEDNTSPPQSTVEFAELGDDETVGHEGVAVEET